jgi:hypothetical protein
VYVAPEVRDCEIRNTLLQCGGPWQALQVGGSTRLNVENCVLTAQASAFNLDLFSFPDQDRCVTLRGNTVVARSGILIQMHGPPLQPPKGRIHFVTAGNLFVGKGSDGKGKDSTFVSLNTFTPRDKAPLAMGIKFLQEGFVWKGEKDLFALNCDVAHVGWNNGIDGSEWVPLEDVPEVGKHIAGGTVVGPDAVRFVQADAATVDLQPADFRLADDSAGKGKAEGGKNAGADVDLVGPGEAYEKWQKTKDYEEWRKQTGALLGNAAEQ